MHKPWQHDSLWENMVWTMFYCEKLDTIIHVEGRFRVITYHNAIEVQVDVFIAIILQKPKHILTGQCRVPPLAYCPELTSEI